MAPSTRSLTLALWLPLLGSIAAACGRATGGGSDPPPSLDVSCSEDADCAELGPDHGCASGSCRSEASGPPLPMPTPPEPVPEERPDSPDPPQEEFFPLPAGATCEALQNGALNEPLTVHVRNQRSKTLYVEPFRIAGSCVAERPLVRVQRAGADVTVLPESSCLLECADYVADPGRSDTPNCSLALCELREVTPLEPGQELTQSYDREWTHFTLFLPPECRAGVPMDPLSNGGRCARYGALPDGEYTLTATAFTAFSEADPDDRYCRAAPRGAASAPCNIGVEGTELTASVTTTRVRGDIDLVFTE